MLLRRFHEQLPLARVVAAWLFDIDMFPGGTAEDGGGRMPVIARRHHEDIYVLVIQNASEIGHGFRRFAGDFFHLSRGALNALLIDVADVSKFDVCLLGETLRQLRAAAARTHDADD